MKSLNTIFLFFLSSISFANDIDKLQTIQEVNSFLIRKVNKKFKDQLPLDESQRKEDATKYVRNKFFQTEITNGLTRNTFFKIDIDNNGLTDLIIYGYEHLLVILDSGKKKLLLYYIDNGIFLENTATLITIDSFRLPRKLIIQQSEKPKNQVDTLIFKFDEFVEYNPNPINGIDLEQIKFSTDRCFGKCPVFEMIIRRDKTATYKAIENNSETGEFKGVIPENEFHELIELLNYIRFYKLDDIYEVNWSDDQTAETQIKFNKTKIKFIRDYGMIGTYGLNALYAKFFTCRNSIEWTE